MAMLYLQIMNLVAFPKRVLLNGIQQQPQVKQMQETCRAVQYLRKCELRKSGLLSGLQ